MFCRKCGEEIPDDSDFCYKCGTRVAAVENLERSVPVAVNLEKDKQTVEKSNVLLGKPTTPIIKNGERFCPTCGKKMVAPWCTYCGEDFSQNSENGAAFKMQEAGMEIPQEQNAHPAIHRCEFCGKEILGNEEFCSRCNAPNPDYKGKKVESKPYDAPKVEEKNVRPTPEEFAQRTYNKALNEVIAEEQKKDAKTPVLLVNTVAVTKIICIAALALALFSELVIARNIPINTFDDINNRNMVIIFSYFFYGIFFCGLLVRIICAMIICSKRGEMRGVIIFICIGLIITIIVGAISKSWVGTFALFGLIAFAYIGNKIKDWL